jgi:hypothetical protein
MPLAFPYVKSLKGAQGGMSLLAAFKRHAERHKEQRMHEINGATKIARWLLSHFGCSPNNDAVIGDLDERYRAGGCSGVWYWTQAFIALVLGLIKEILSNKLLAILAVLQGGAVKAAWIAVINDSRSLPWVHKAEDDLRICMAFAILTVATCAASAWLVGRVSDPHGRAMVLFYLLVELASVPAMFVFRYLWVWPFSMAVDIGLRHLGEGPTVLAFWLGMVLMTLTIILGSGKFGASGQQHPGQRRSVGTAE